MRLGPRLIAIRRNLVVGEKKVERGPKINSSNLPTRRMTKPTKTDRPTSLPYPTESLLLPITINTFFMSSVF